MAKINDPFTGLIVYTENGKLLSLEFDHFVADFTGQPFYRSSANNKFGDFVITFKENVFILDFIINGSSIMNLFHWGNEGNTVWESLTHFTPLELYNMQNNLNFDFLSKLTTQDFRRAGSVLDGTGEAINF